MDDHRRIFSEGYVSHLRSLPSSFLSNQANLLSTRQLLELNASVLQYLRPILQSDPETYSKIESIFTEKFTNLNDEQKENQKLKSSLSSIEIPDNYLQKKWSTVLRLQRNIKDLELQNESLMERNEQLTKTVEELSNNIASQQSDNSPSTITKLNWIPSFLKNSLKYHTSPITALAIHPFNPHLITASQDGMIVIWNLLDLSEPINIINNAHSKSINSLVFQNHTSILISCSSDQIIKIWDISSPTNVVIPIKTLTGHEHIISSLATSSKDKNIIFSSSRDKTIKVWDLQSGWTVRTIKGHSDWVRSIDCMGDYLLSCSSDTSIRLTHWPTGTGVGLCLGHKQVIEDVKFFPLKSNEYLDCLLNEEKDYDDLNIDYKYAVSCGRDKLIKIWKLPLPDYNSINGSPIPNNMNPYGVCIKEIKGHKSWVRNIQLHYNGRYLISCSDDQMIKVWDLSDLNNDDIEPVASFHGHQSFVNTIAIASPTEEGDLSNDNIRCYLVSGGADNLVNIWV